MLCGTGENFDLQSLLKMSLFLHLISFMLKVCYV